MSGRPTSTEASALSLARRLLGDRAELSPVRTPGMETHAYQVTTPSRVACLRIGSSTDGFAKDRWAFELLGDRLPIPRVWEIGELDTHVAFCLSEWAPGVTMQDLSAAEVDHILPAVFDAWTTLQSVDLEDLPGRPDEQPHTFPELEHLAVLATVLAEYRRLGERIPHERSLVHGDWGANNLLVADGRITGILDWESITIGDPIQDIAGWFWATWPPVVTCMTRQAAYADRRLGHLPHYRDRVLYHDLRIGLHEITAALRDGDQDFADWAANRCRELVEG